MRFLRQLNAQALKKQLQFQEQTIPLALAGKDVIGQAQLVQVDCCFWFANFTNY